MIRLVAVRVDGRPVKPSGRCGRGHGFSVAFPRSLLVVEVLCDDEQLLRRKSELILYWKRVP
jgi:ribosomal 50S subunit-recycling heat shock protein